MGKHILVAGGGIGGLTAALCLAKTCLANNGLAKTGLANSGHHVTVLERGSRFVEAGAGIQLSPNCSRVLHYLGLQQPLQQVGFLPQANQFRDWQSGRVITENVLGDELKAKYGAPYYHIHRADLLQILVAACENNPNITLTLNAGVTAAVDDGSSVTVTTDKGRYHGDLLVGADGIHSVVRTVLWGQQQPVFTGNIAWRALVPANQLPAGLIRPMSTVWWGPGKHFVHYYVRQGELVNCVCVVEKEGWTVESWTEPGDAAELKADFAGWHSDIQQLLDHADQDSLFKWALFDRPPMQQWGKGRMTLLGDACHPTLPFMAQGAAMAIEDAAVLAAVLNAETDTETALQQYELLRKHRTASIQTGSRRNATVFHLGGVKAWLRNKAARTAGGRTMDNLYRYDPLTAVTDSGAH